MSKRLYFDHNATSPLRPSVAKAISALLNWPMANPQSVHASGQFLRKLIDDAKQDLANLIHADPKEIFFCPSGSYANAMAWEFFANKKLNVLTSNIEHQSILKCTSMTTSDFVHLSKNNEYELNERSYDAVSISHSNNETGRLLPIDQLFAHERLKNCFKHVDAVQSLGKVKLDAKALQVDMISLSAHKVGALAGVGALYVNKNSEAHAFFSSSNSKFLNHLGTPNTLGIHAFGQACLDLLQNQDLEHEHLRIVRDHFENELSKKIPGVVFIDQHLRRLPNTSDVLFPNLTGENFVILSDLEGMDVSMGSACSSGMLMPSHVITGIGYSEAQAKSVIRFSFGANSSMSDVERGVDLAHKIYLRVTNHET